MLSVFERRMPAAVGGTITAVTNNTQLTQNK